MPLSTFSSVAFYRDDFLCFTNPFELSFTYRNCCENGDSDCWKGNQLSFSKCCWDSHLYQSTVNCESEEVSYCLGKLGFLSILTEERIPDSTRFQEVEQLDVAAADDWFQKQALEDNLKLLPQLPAQNLGLRMNQACLRSDLTDGSRFGVEEMADASKLSNLWDIARFSCETWQNFLRQLLMPTVQILYSTSQGAGDLPRVPEGDRQTFQSLIHDYKAHTWEVGENFQHLIDLGPEDRDESGSSTTKIDLAKELGVSASSPFAGLLLSDAESAVQATDSALAELDVPQWNEEDESGSSAIRTEEEVSLEPFLQLLEVLNAHEASQRRVRRALTRASPFSLRHEGRERALLTAAELQQVLDALDPGSWSLGERVVDVARHTLDFQREWRGLRAAQSWLKERRMAQLDTKRKNIIRFIGQFEPESAEEGEEIKKSLIEGFDEARRRADVELDSIEDSLRNIWTEKEAELKQLLAAFGQAFGEVAERLGSLMESISELYHRRLARFLKQGCESDVCDRAQVKERTLFGNVTVFSPNFEIPRQKFLILPDCPALKRGPGLRMGESHLWPPPLQMPQIFRSDFLLYGAANHESAFYMQKQSSSSWSAEFGTSRDRLGNLLVEKSEITETREQVTVWDAESFAIILSSSEAETSVAQIRARLLDNLASKRALPSDYAMDVWTNEDLLFLDRVNTTASSYEADTVFVLDAQVLRYREKENLTAVAVLGSERPWIELVLLYRLPKHVRIVTIDYREPPFSQHPHPRWSFLPFSALLEEPDFKFDAIFSFSSIEHAGLGRYGEPLNPFADVQTMALVWCHTKNDGYFFLGPNCYRTCSWLSETSSDVVYFNAGRDYGANGWSRLTMSWELDLNMTTGKFFHRDITAKRSVGYVALLKRL